MAAPKPVLTPEQQQRALEMYDQGRGTSIPDIAKHFRVGHMSIRRILDPAKYNRPAKQDYNRREYAITAKDTRTPEIVVSDVPDHPMARLIQEGPTPERRRLMAEGRI